MATKREMLEEAIADAKAVKEMAIANAKAALEEAFTPQLNNLFSLKLQEMDTEESEEESEELEEVMDKDTMDEVDLEELLAELNEEESEESEEEESEEEESEEEESEEEESIGDLTREELEKMIEDILAEEFPELINKEESEEEESEEEEDIELAEILAEIESMEEESEEEGMMYEEEEEEGMMYEEEEEEGKLEETSRISELEAELAEALNTIQSLRGDLNEVNLLNAKLLYTNKIFKAKNLTESQKLKVLGSFDKATNVKEVKLVFETLNEGLKVKKSTIKENLGRASKTTNTPIVKQPIVESNDVFKRMQKLAGLI